MRIVMDTNAYMMPVECDVRVFDELSRLLGTYESITPRAVIEELEKLSGTHGTERVAASVGRDLADRSTVVDTDAEYADDAVLECAAECDYAVTNDGPLKRRLLDAGVPVICLRGGSKLHITNP
ncbi:PIN domain-containing protein [Natronomonas sp. EA1]|uniref:PIN domain-containing protein n=1 Tax=Natronomonas sp. EA1 TaxID=3421655 RepID=UPI003EBE09F9